MAGFVKPAFIDVADQLEQVAGLVGLLERVEPGDVVLESRVLRIDRRR